MTEFEQATLETLVSFKASKPEQINRLLTDKALQAEAKALVKKWNEQRIKLGFTPW